MHAYGAGAPSAPAKVAISKKILAGPSRLGHSNGAAVPAGRGAAARRTKRWTPLGVVATRTARGAGQGLRVVRDACADARACPRAAAVRGRLRDARVHPLAASWRSARATRAPGTARGAGGAQGGATAC